MADRRSLFDRLFNWGARGHSTSPLSWNDFLSYFTYGGLGYQLSPAYTMDASQQEEPSRTFEGLVHGVYKSNGVVFACMLARLLLFSEARFQYRRIRSGRPGELWGNDELRVLEKPWPNGTTGDLLTRAIQDADLSGNFYAYRQRDRIRRLRPDWVSIVIGSDSSPDEAGWAIDAEIAGYLYHPGGYRAQTTPIVLLPEQVAHFAPIPDPAARFRGMSWIEPVIREIMGDAAATEHKLRFFENGATVNLALSYPEGMTKELFDAYVKAFEEGHQGVANAYRTLHLGAGATPVPVGSNMEELDFKVVQGAGETRIAAAAGVPPVIVGLSEGLQQATYSNYAQARRRFADGTMRPLWRNMAASLSSLIRVPSDSELWYDDRDIPFLQEDVADAAKILTTNATAIRTLTDGGFDPASAVAAVVSGDLNKLKHTGMLSVQMQPPGTVGDEPPPAEDAPPANGDGDVPIGEAV